MRLLFRAAINFEPSAEQATEVPPIPGRLLDTKEFQPSCDVYTAPGVESVKAISLFPSPEEATEIQFPKICTGKL